MILFMCVLLKACRYTATMPSRSDGVHGVRVNGGMVRLAYYCELRRVRFGIKDFVFSNWDSGKSDNAGIEFKITFAALE
jgi:hypothetical protein